MKCWQRDLYADDSLERAMFGRRWRRAESSFPVGSILFFGLLILAALAHFAG